MAWSLAIARGATAAQWRADLPALRDRGLVGVGAGGAVSSVVTQFFGLLPLGSQAERAAAGSALALALASASLYRLGRRVVAARLGPHRGEAPLFDDRMTAVLAGVAALTTALSPSWQAEGTVGGGVAVALALVLGGLEATADLTTEGVSFSPRATRRWLGVAAYAGLAFAESPPAALALFVVASAMVVTSDRRPPSRLGLTRGIDKRFRDATNKGSIFLAHLKLDADEALTLLAKAETIERGFASSGHNSALRRISGNTPEISIRRNAA